jgi:hypothetical protein
VVLVTRDSASVDSVTRGSFTGILVTKDLVIGD